MLNYCVTIAREYGSCGRIIGKRLADHLSIPFYDRELITLAAQESGLAEDYIETVDQRRTSGLIYSMYMAGRELPIPEQVFLAQSRAIRNAAEKGSCVIIGRCADYVLRDHENCLRVFIHAPLDWRVKVVRDEYREGESPFEEHVRREDKNRAAYYNFFTQEKWGKAQNYHLCLDSSLGVASSVRLLKGLVEEFTGDFI
jgi:hypothetical protein